MLLFKFYNEKSVKLFNSFIFNSLCNDKYLTVRFIRILQVKGVWLDVYISFGSVIGLSEKTYLIVLLGLSYLYESSRFCYDSFFRFQPLKVPTSVLTSLVFSMMFIIAFLFVCLFKFSYFVSLYLNLYLFLN